MPSSGRWMALFAGEFRRLRAASYFAHGGASSQSPLDTVSAWRRKLRSFPCSSSSRRTHFAGLRREQRGIGQNAAGDAADGLRLRYAPPRSIGPLSPDPIYGGYPLKWAEYFRRAKSGVPECGPVRPHQGPEREENWDCCGSASAPGFAEPTLPVCFLCRGDPRGRPQAFPLGGRCPRRGRMRGR